MAGAKFNKNAKNNFVQPPPTMISTLKTEYFTIRDLRTAHPPISYLGKIKPASLGIWATLGKLENQLTGNNIWTLV